MDILTLGSGVNYRTFNTKSQAGLPITLAGGSLRARVNGGNWVNSGLTLVVDHTFNGGVAVTGLHRVAIDVDNVALALVAGDFLEVDLNTGTVDTLSVIGTKLFQFHIVDDGLTVAEQADVYAATQLGVSLGAGYGGKNVFEALRALLAVALGVSDKTNATTAKIYTPDGLTLVATVTFDAVTGEVTNVVFA